MVEGMIIGEKRTLKTGLVNELNECRATIIWLGIFVLVCILTWVLAEFTHVIGNVSFVNFVLFILVFFLVLSTWRVVGKNVSNCWKWSTLIGTVIFGMLIWFTYSYTSYYNGVASNLHQSRRVIFEAYGQILATGESDDMKKKRILAVSENLYRAKFTIYKDGNVYLQKEPVPASVDYVEERIFAGKLGTYHGSEYSIEFNLFNRPNELCGLLRAVTFSVWRTGYEWDNKIWYDKYFLRNRNYRRSMNFYVVFLTSYILLMWVGRLYAKVESANKKLGTANDELKSTNDKLEMAKAALESKKKDLESANKKLETANDKLESNNEELKKINEELEQKNTELENRKLTYGQMEKEFRRVVSDSQNNLQHGLSNFDKKEDEETLEAVYKAAAGSGRHDAINKIRELPKLTKLDDNDLQLITFKAVLYKMQNESGSINIIQEIYDVILSPWIEEIREELRGLEGTLSLETREHTVAEIIDEVQGIKDELSRNEEADKYNLHIEDAGDNAVVYDEKCKVNLQRVKSIVHNLIGNSNKANQSYESSLFDKVESNEISGEELENYSGKIWINIWQETDRLCVQIKDNGGGFPDDIIKDIYHKPVRTTKDDRDHGEGTAYIGFFCKHMNIDIKAENIDNGAATTLHIPLGPQKDEV